MTPIKAFSFTVGEATLKPYLPKLKTTHNLKQLKYSHAALLN